MSNTAPKFSLNMVLLQNPTSKKYTAYFSQFPEVIIDAESEKEAAEVLISTLHIYLSCEHCHEIKEENRIENLTTKVLDFNCEFA